MSLDLTTATHETFEPYVGQAFSTEVQGFTVKLELDNIKVHTAVNIRDNRLLVDGREIPPRQAFSLIFVGPQEPLIDNTMAKLHHSDLGSVELYLSPFRQDIDGALYEVAFS